jgi:hypothetical protein
MIYFEVLAELYARILLLESLVGLIIIVGLVMFVAAIRRRKNP